MRRRYSPSLVPVALLTGFLLVGASACGGQPPSAASDAGPGTGSAATNEAEAGASGTTESGSEAGRGKDLTGVDPCTLLTTAQQDELQIRDATSKPKNYAGGLECQLYGPRFTLNLTSFSDSGLADFEATNGPAEDATVGPFPAKKQASESGCKVSVGVNESSRVDVFTTYGSDDPKRACAQSTRAAELMVPQLRG